MKPCHFISVLIFSVVSASFGGQWKLENESIAWSGTSADGALRPSQLEDKINGKVLALSGECFQVELDNGTVLKSSDFKPVGEPNIEPLKADLASPVFARQFPGRELVVKLAASDKHLSAEWRVLVRDGSAYVRQQLALHATGQDVQVREIQLFAQKVPGAATVGKVDGSPVVAGNFFLGYEHPMARNTVDADGVVHCRFLRSAVLQAGETLTQSCVLGVVPAGQLRRGFLAYVERERAHPYRPFWVRCRRIRKGRFPDFFDMVYLAC